MTLLRVRQFARAVCARVSPADRAFAESWLPVGARPLFFAMAEPDQCHAIRTARTADELAAASPGGCDRALLMRCALLHDVGRRRGALGTFWKAAAVLLAAARPAWARACGAPDAARTGLLHEKLVVYFHHAEMGAEALFRRGFAAEAAIVRRHHEAPAEDDPPELRFLRIADQKS